MQPTHDGDKTNNMEKTELQRIADATERTAKNVAFFTWIVIISFAAGLFLITYGDQMH